jgi:hypothetical protein
MSIEDLPRPGRLWTSRNEDNIEKVRQTINEDLRKTIEKVSDETNVSWSSCQRNLTEDLRMRRVALQFCASLAHRGAERQSRECLPRLEEGTA